MALAIAPLRPTPFTFGTGELTIYGYGFFPKVPGNGSGGFDWYYDEGAAKKHFAVATDTWAENERVLYPFVAQVTAPTGTIAERAQAITDLLDNHLSDRETAVLGYFQWLDRLADEGEVTD
jgi:hypothetical protein